MNQNDPRNLLSTDLQHRTETLFAGRAKVTEVLMTLRLQEFQLDMVYRIRDRCESLVTTVTSRAGTCFANMCCMATVLDNLLFETITLTHDNNQFITLVIKQFFEDRTLNDDFYNKLDSYLTNLRNRYFDNIPSDLTTSSGGNARQ
ncbi:hypothetical protein PGTUg99_028421 [Puccinia graminis f. sp. tritici]|uniref:Uncharacterized protein n=1 Tax=Puccinia graminis f. sp. tritici TaxID=56615 RepID=A0A5B0QS39_PUCGR|nr:hypothetical protein PGTUg99_028421 [Puccinia graminis f. sp. tritici]